MAPLETLAEVADDERQVPLALFLIYLLVLTPTHSRIEDWVGFAVCLLAMVGLLAPWFARRANFWVLMAAMLWFNLAFSYSHSANHYFLTIYVASYLALDAYLVSKGYARTNRVPRGLLVIVFAFATLQKLLSPYFLSGRLLANYFLKGHSLPGVLPWVQPNHGDLLREYGAAFGEASDGALIGIDSVPLLLPESFVLVCKLLAVVIILYEALFLLALLWNRLFDHSLFALLVLVFVWGTALMRHEFHFLGLLCILVLFANSSLRPRWRLALVGSAILFLALGTSDPYIPI